MACSCDGCCCDGKSKKEAPKGLSWLEMILYFLGLYKPPQPPNPNPQPDPEESESSEADTEDTGEKGMKRALCIGINDYKGTSNDLAGCVNDAKNWAALLKDQYGFDEVKTLFDSNATIRNVSDNIKELRSKSNNGDIAVITYSGHGSNVPDAYPIDEADGRDETLYLYDGHLRDDQLRDLFDGFDLGVKLTFISDSCHSGTNTRAVMSDMETTEKTPKPRYMPPEDEHEALAISRLPVRNRVGLPQEDMNEVLITGCKDTEYSYDANINGKPTGAMSYFAIKVLKENPDVTYKEFFAKLRKELPSSRYPQTPQLEGSEENKNSKMFK